MGCFYCNLWMYQYQCATEYWSGPLIFQKVCQISGAYSGFISGGPTFFLGPALQVFTLGGPPAPLIRPCQILFRLQHPICKFRAYKLKSALCKTLVYTVQQELSLFFISIYSGLWLLSLQKIYSNCKSKHNKTKILTTCCSQINAV